MSSSEDYHFTFVMTRDGADLEFLGTFGMTSVDYWRRGPDAVAKAVEGERKRYTKALRMHGYIDGYSVRVLRERGKPARRVFPGVDVPPRAAAVTGGL
jgi:hypothetical protein